MKSDPDFIRRLGRQLRVDSVRVSDAAGSGHPTSSMSGADLIAVLFAEHLHYDFNHPEHPGNDHVIFSKGHATPLLYSAYLASGAISEDEFMTYRTLGSRLEGHPTPTLPWVDVATGSLGQGLPTGVGIALGARQLESPAQTWVLCGDGELAEGSMWEAFEHAGYLGLGNLTAMVDVNRLGQRGPTRHEWDVDAYRRRVEAFDWHVMTIDGHDVEAIDQSLSEAASTTDRPSVILARTHKGSGVETVDDAGSAHGKPLGDPDEAIAELGGVTQERIHVRGPEGPDRATTSPTSVAVPTYDVADEMATRDAFGHTLVALGDARSDVVVLDGEVADSTRTQGFADAHPERFYECYIAEQEMLATAVGLQTWGLVPYAATFAAFWTRAHDFIRMAATSRADLNLVGSHAGVEIGADGPSQMGLDDVAMFRAIHGSVVLHPCDANSTARLTAQMSEHPGISYLRTLRGKTPVIYRADEEFEIGGSKQLRYSTDDDVTVVAAGATVYEAMDASDRLAPLGINVRVLDMYSIKPIDAEALQEAARETRALLVVEDHWHEGGLGDAVLDAFATGQPVPRIVKMAVTEIPGSATPSEQLSSAGIDADAIAEAAANIANSRFEPLVGTA